MSASAQYHPCADLADQIAAARTFADLAVVRRNLQHTIGILDTERAALAYALQARENSLINFYLPKLGAKLGGAR